MSTSLDGLQFPINSASNKASTSQTGKEIIAEALSIVDNKSSMDALTERNWRKNYPIAKFLIIYHNRSYGILNRF